MVSPSSATSSSSETARSRRCADPASFAPFLRHQPSLLSSHRVVVVFPSMRSWYFPSWWSHLRLISARVVLSSRFRAIFASIRPRTCTARAETPPFLPFHRRRFLTRAKRWLPTRCPRRHHRCRRRPSPPSSSALPSLSSSRGQNSARTQSPPGRESLLQQSSTSFSQGQRRQQKTPPPPENKKKKKKRGVLPDALSFQKRPLSFLERVGRRTQRLGDVCVLRRKNLSVLFFV